MRRQRKAELIREQERVVACGHGIAIGQLGDRPQQPLTAYHHDVGRGELLRELIRLLGRVRIVQVERDAGVLPGIDAVARPGQPEGGAGVRRRHQDRQRIVPDFHRDGRTWGDVVVDPFGGLHPRIGRAVDIGERQPEKARRRHHSDAERGHGHLPPLRAKPRREPAPERSWPGDRLPPRCTRRRALSARQVARESAQRRRAAQRQQREERQHVARELGVGAADDREVDEQPRDDDEPVALPAAPHTHSSPGRARQAQEAQRQPHVVQQQLLYLIEVRRGPRELPHVGVVQLSLREGRLLVYLQLEVVPVNQHVRAGEHEGQDGRGAHP